MYACPFLHKWMNIWKWTGMYDNESLEFVAQLKDSAT